MPQRNDQFYPDLSRIQDPEVQRVLRLIIDRSNTQDAAITSTTTEADSIAAGPTAFFTTSDYEAVRTAMQAGGDAPIQAPLLVGAPPIGVIGVWQSQTNGTGSDVVWDTPIATHPNYLLGADDATLTDLTQLQILEDGFYLVTCMLAMAGDPEIDLVQGQGASAGTEVIVAQGFAAPGGSEGTYTLTFALIIQASANDYIRVHSPSGNFNLASTGEQNVLSIVRLA